MRHTPSTRQYPLGQRSGKILFGRKCNPVMMKQEGTVSFGRRAKDAPVPHSGRNLNKARAAREQAKFSGRSPLKIREAYHTMLAFLVNREIAGYPQGVIMDMPKVRQELRTNLRAKALMDVERGYRIVGGERVFA